MCSCLNAWKAPFPCSRPPPLSLMILPPLFRDDLSVSLEDRSMTLMSILCLSSLQSLIFLHVDHMWVSVITALCYKKQLLEWGWRDAIVYEHSSTSLGVILIQCSFRRIVVGVPLQPITDVATGSGPIANGKYVLYLVQQALNPIIGWLITPITFIHSTTALVGIVH